MSYSFGNSNTEVRIQHFLLTQSGSYQEQNLRPFKTRINESAISRLETATHGGRNLGVAAVQGLAAELIQPIAVPEGQVNIAHGWHSRRFRFLMHVVESHPFAVNEVTHRILFGYTDNCDASMNYLDPEMRVYFNSETLITEAVQQTINGPVKKAMVVGSNQIVSPSDFLGGNSNALYNRPTSHLIRPEDVFSIGQTNQAIEMLKHTGQFTGEIQHRIDGRTMVGQGGSYKYSKRRDTSPTRYLSDTLGAYQHAIKEANMSGGFDNEPLNMEAVYSEAQAASSNHDISSNTFLGRLKDHASYMDKGFVTYRELCSLFPEAGDTQNCTKFSMDTGRSIRVVNHADQAMHWNGSEPITIAASLLAQVIPAIMMDNFIRTISFASRNGMGAGMYITDIHGGNVRMLINGLDAVSYINEFQRRLIVDIFNTVTHNNQVPFQVSVFADLGEDTVIDIALGSEPVRRYVAPTFTDSLFSPMITRNERALHEISSDMLYLIGNVIPTGNTANQAPIYMPPIPEAQINHLAPNTSTVGYHHDFGAL